MRYFYLILAIVICTNLDAQIKEVNLLGKSLKLHGIDLKIKSQRNSIEYYTNSLTYANCPNDQYQTYINSLHIRGATNPEIPPLNAIGVAAVFRPFYNLEMNWIRRFELIHEINLIRINAEASDGNENLLFRSFHMGYQPKLQLSSGTIAQYLRVYATGFGLVNLPLRSYIYTNVPVQYLSNNSDGYLKNEIYYSDRLGGNPIEYGIGYGLGIKMNLSCHWNFHLEVNRALISTYYLHNPAYKTSSFLQGTVGLRYKFANPEDSSEEGERLKPNLFW